MHLILAGGGLANSLIAYRLGQRRPEVGVTVVEAGETIGGNHTWSFHATDLSPEQQAWVEPLLEARWSSYDVAFPAFRRHVPLAYRSIASERLDRVVRAEGAATLRLGARAAEVRPTGVALDTGEILSADAVVDGRGYRPSPHLTMAYQKFLGIEMRTRVAHGLEHPIVMDATVPQHDGFRFVYVLPFAPDRLLVEDTYYSDRMELDVAATREAIARYAREAGWVTAGIVREETGVLPIALGGDFDAFWPASDDLPRSGMRAALFHATTGYSLPEAVRLADHIATLPDLSAPALSRATRAHARAAWRRGGFDRLLGRMLFRAAEPEERYRLLERFYRLSPGLAARFYAGRSTLVDKARVLIGKPPVPIGRALRCFADGPTEAASS